MGATFKLVSVVGTSPDSIEDAIQGAIRSASKSLRHLSWFEVLETRGKIDGDRAVEYQVTLQLGFKVDPH